MVTIRRAKAEDLIKMQSTNLLCLPENYSFKYYIYHYLSWPVLLYCAEDYDGTIAGYVLAKLEEDEEDPKIVHGHITSISILREYRRMGIATKLMKQSLNMMNEYYNTKFCSLHVRANNTPALDMYNKVLGFE
jgi:N-alpha-acetyltransferase 10/11